MRNREPTAFRVWSPGPEPGILGVPSNAGTLRAGFAGESTALLPIFT